MFVPSPGAPQPAKTRRAARSPAGYHDDMDARLWFGMLALFGLIATGCGNVVADPAPRATQAPNVRCFDQPPAGSPGQDPNARPMFFLFCMQSP
jgi:hypothetical protein